MSSVTRASIVHSAKAQAKAIEEDSLAKAPKALGVAIPKVDSVKDPRAKGRKEDGRDMEKVHTQLRNHGMSTHGMTGVHPVSADALTRSLMPMMKK